MRATKISQMFGVLTTLVGKPALLPSTHVMAHNLL